MVYAMAGLILVVLAQTAVTWRLSTRIAAAERLDRRLGHFVEALGLLTDTTEAGFANVAMEREQAGRPRTSRPASTPAAPRSTARSTTPRATARRIKTATRSGREVAEIAADEGMSESEVRLYLGMTRDPDAVSPPTTTRGARGGTLRLS
jgi:hypothetical protein